MARWSPSISRMPSSTLRSLKLAICRLMRVDAHASRSSREWPASSECASYWPYSVCKRRSAGLVIFMRSSEGNHSPLR
jgi:hypothetical protein